jgi:hypothetical protein
MAMNDPHDKDRTGNVPPQHTRPADIPVQRTGAATPVATETRRSSPLKWLIPLLLLLVIGYALTRNRRAEPEVAAVDPSSTQQTATGEVAGGAAATGAAAGAAAGATTGGGAVQQFITWANEGGNDALPQESEDNHPYTSQGLRLMADALAAASTGRSQFTQGVADIRAQAQRLQTSSDNDQHAEYAHAAFVSAARMIGELRGTPANELTQSANLIQPALPLSPQGNEVRSFFRQAATAMQQLPAAQGGM